MRSVRFEGFLKDGSKAGDGPQLPQRPWTIRLTDLDTGEQVLRVLHATIEVDHTVLPTAQLTFSDGTTEDVFAYIG